MILALPTVTAFGVVSTAVVESSSEIFNVLSLALSDTTVFAGTQTNGLFVSPDNGTTVGICQPNVE